MTPRDVVLVVADATDPTADRVCAVLAARAARFFRFDTADVPQRLGLRAEPGTTSWHGELATAEGRVDLDEVGAVYVRRPRAFEPPAHLSAIEQWHAAIECRYALGGFWPALAGCAGAICPPTPPMPPTNPSSCVTSGPAAWPRHQR